MNPNLTNPVQLTNAGRYAIQAARTAATNRMAVSARFLEMLLPADKVLYRMRVRGSGSRPMWLHFVWPGVLQLVDAQGCVLKQEIAGHMAEQMPFETAMLRERLAPDAVLLKGVLRRPQTPALKVTLDASGVLRVMDARKRTLMGFSEPGVPGVLSRYYTGLSFHDLRPQIR
ncbi:MAG: hypothetical protein RR811_11535 [Comamonas sp.]